MAAVKWIFVVLFGLGSAGSLALAFTGSGAPRTVVPRSAPELSLRQFPVLVAVAGLPKSPDGEKAPEPEPTKAPEPVAAKPPEPVAVKTPEPVAAKTPEPVAAKTPEPVAAKTPEPVAAKTPEPVAAKAPEPVAAKTPEPVAAKPPEPVAAPPKAEGMINLRASDTADVYLDGKKLGGSPLLGVKARAGNHKVRFDCYDSAGNTVAGPVQVISVKADAEVDVEFPCPVEE